MFRLGYNTNGLAHHRILDALDLLAELGYEGVAITPDVGGLDPCEPEPGLAARVRERAEAAGLSLAVESGARYLLDPRRKHSPTLLDATPAARAAHRLPAPHDRPGGRARRRNRLDLVGSSARRRARERRRPPARKRR